MAQLKLGWSEAALIAGARDAGVSPAIVGSFPRKEAALVEVNIICMYIYVDLLYISGVYQQMNPIFHLFRLC